MGTKPGWEAEPELAMVVVEGSVSKGERRAGVKTKEKFKW